MVTYLDKKDLWRLNTEMRESFISGSLAEPAHRYGFNLTSGTSSGKPLMVASRYPDEMYHRFSKLERPIILFGAMTAKLSQAVWFFYGNESSSASTLLLDASDLELGVELGRLVEDFEPDSIFGFPTPIVQLLENIQNPKALSGVKVLGFIGEVLSKQKEEVLRKAMPDAVVAGVYGNAELGAISKELCAGSSIPACPYLPINQYHPNDDGGVKIEIIDQDEHGIGEVVISLKGFLYPVAVERYRTGDVGRFIERECECGNPVTFELMGRKGFDYIKLAGVLLLQQEFDRVMGTLRTYVEDYRVTAREQLLEGKVVGEVTMQIIATHAFQEEAKSVEWVRKHIARELFVTPKRTFAEMEERGILLPLVVALTDVFPAMHKGIKLRQITQ